MWIKVMDDHGCWPLWVREAGGDSFDPRDPAELGLSPSLVGRLEAWRQWSDSMVNIADPNDSRPVSGTEHEALAAEGRRLAARVGEELPRARAWYYEDPEPAPVIGRARNGPVSGESPADAGTIPSFTGAHAITTSRLRTLLGALASMAGKAVPFGGDHRCPKHRAGPWTG